MRKAPALNKQQQAYDAQVRERAKKLRELVKQCESEQAELQRLDNEIDQAKVEYWPEHPTMIELTGKRFVLNDKITMQLHHRDGPPAIRLRNLERDNPRAFSKPWHTEVELRHNAAYEKKIKVAENDLRKWRSLLIEPYEPVK